MNELKLQKQKDLQKHKNIALWLLILAFIWFLISSYYKIEWLKMFFEASLVWWLADWFAVVALFRHPLGLKIIPHTAIIPSNKDRIANNLAIFIVSEFITEERIKKELDKHNFVQIIADSLKSNNTLWFFIDSIISNIDKDDKLNSYIKNTLKEKIINNKEVFEKYIKNTIDSWDKDDITQKIELEVWKDLQFIRYNWMLMWGIVWLMIYFIQVLIF